MRAVQRAPGRVSKTGIIISQVKILSIANNYVAPNYVTDCPLSSLCILTCVIFTVVLGSRYYYYPYTQMRKLRH